jgi:hypothetical protein
MPDPINPRFLRIYHVSKLAIEKGGILSPKPVPHTQAALDHTDLATDLLVNITWATRRLPVHKQPGASQHKQLHKYH